MNMDKRKWMKVTAVIVCIVLLAGVVLNQTGILKITTANADLWDGQFPEVNEKATYGKYNGSQGNGSAKSPYYITTARDLAQFAVNVNAGVYKGKANNYFTLTADINLNSQEWTAIGTPRNPFDGHFNVVDGHTITYMQLTLGGEKNTDQGFFGYLSGAEVKGLTLTGNITMDSQTGQDIGGIAGYNINSTIENCSFAGNVTGNTNVGGIVGFCSAKSGSAEVNGCTVVRDSKIEAKNMAVGGIAGTVQSGAVVLNCSNFGSVKLDSTSTQDKASASGLVGYMDNAVLVNSFNSGRVEGGQYASGITAGTNVTILNCYNRALISGTAGRKGSISGKLDKSSILNNVFYLVGTDNEDIAGGFYGIAIKNVGSVTDHESEITKATWVSDDKWTIQKQTILDVLGEYVSNSGTDYRMYEWAEDGAYSNENFPILTKKVGHKHDRNGDIEVKTQPTCTEEGWALYHCSQCDYYVGDIIRENGHKLGSKVIAATCTTTGAAMEVCTVCNSVETYVELKALEHKMDDYTQEPTCEADGYTVRRCTRANCGYEDEASRIVTSALGHNEVEKNIPADCLNNEKRVRTCSVCGNIRTIDVTGTALGHEWDYEEGTPVAATCVEDGGDVRTCGRCNYAEIIDGTLVEHYKVAHKYESTVIPATCEERGYTLERCSVATCGSERKVNYVNALNHNMYGANVVPATCKERGYTVFKCTRCDYTYNDKYTETKAHNYIQQSIKPQSCLESGSITYKCQYCDETYSDPIPMIGSHNYVRRTDLDKAATCTEQGYTVEKCTQCGDEQKTDTSALNHTYEDTVVPPDCTTKGYTLHKCVRCDDMTRDNETGELGHSYTETVVEPTTTSRGYTLKACVRGDDEERSHYIAATPNASFNALERRLTLSNIEAETESDTNTRNKRMHILEDTGELMKYSLDGGESWVTTEAVSVVLEEEDLDYEKGIDVVRPGNDVIPMADSYTQHIELLQADEPGMVTVIKPSMKDGKGSITGVNELMEYRAEADKTWAAIEGDTIENLSPGTYYVRTKATIDVGPSKAVMVIVEDYEPQPPVSEPPIGSDNPIPSPTSSGTPNSNPPQASASVKPPVGSAGPSASAIPSASAKPPVGSAKPSASSKPSASAPSGTQKTQNPNPSGGSSTSNPKGGNANPGGDNGDKNNGSQNTAKPTDDSVVRNNVYYNGNGASKSTGTSSRVTSAKTGDDMPIAIWLSIAGVSLAAFAFVVTKKRKEETE